MFCLVHARPIPNISMVLYVVCTYGSHVTLITTAGEGEREDPATSIAEEEMGLGVQPLSTSLWSGELARVWRG